MITVNTIIDGICKALSEEFGEEYEIYTESVQQDLTEPCFSIVPIKPSINQFLKNRYYRANSFCIYYFPKSADEPLKEIRNVQERLMDCLEYITVDSDKIRGTQMNAEVSDGVLAFFANYDMFVYKTTESIPAMEDLEQGTKVKNDE